MNKEELQNRTKQFNALPKILITEIKQLTRLKALSGTNYCAIYLNQKSKIKNQKSHHGFSLIEVMVAFAILSVAFIAISASFPFGVKINKGAENASIASCLAQEKIEDLISSGYAGIATGTIEIKHRLSNDPGNYLYFYQRETAAAYVDGNLGASATETGMKKISTTVYYREAVGKTEKNYNITTLISQR